MARRKPGKEDKLERSEDEEDIGDALQAMEDKDNTMDWAVFKTRFLGSEDLNHPQ